MTDQLDLENWITENRSQLDLEDWLAVRPIEPKAGELDTSLREKFRVLTLFAHIKERQLTDGKRKTLQSLGAFYVIRRHDAVFVHFERVCVALRNDRIGEALHELSCAQNILADIRVHLLHYRDQLHSGVRPRRMTHLLHADVRAMTAHVPF